jgi:hypothetical protein
MFMSEERNLGWVLLGLGVLLSGIGLVWVQVPEIHRLAGLSSDIRLVLFPLMICLSVGAALTLYLWVVRLVRGREQETLTESGK